MKILSPEQSESVAKAWIVDRAAEPDDWFSPLGGELVPSPGPLCLRALLPAPPPSLARETPSLCGSEYFLLTASFSHPAVSGSLDCALPSCVIYPILRELLFDARDHSRLGDGFAYEVGMSIDERGALSLSAGPLMDGFPEPFAAFLCSMTGQDAKS